MLYINANLSHRSYLEVQKWLQIWPDFIPVWCYFPLVWHPCCNVGPNVWCHWIHNVTSLNTHCDVIKHTILWRHWTHDMTSLNTRCDVTMISPVACICSKGFSLGVKIWSDCHQIWGSFKNSWFIHFSFVLFYSDICPISVNLVFVASVAHCCVDWWLTLWPVWQGCHIWVLSGSAWH